VLVPCKEWRVRHMDGAFPRCADINFSFALFST
jgi:hypothetical protein